MKSASLVGNDESDFLWLCLDNKGCLGVFRPGYSGIVPKSYLDDPDEAGKTALDFLVKLPVGAEPNYDNWLVRPILRGGPLLDSIFRDGKAKRYDQVFASAYSTEGLYTYTSSENNPTTGSSYYRIAKPVPAIFCSSAVPEIFKIIKYNGSFDSCSLILNEDFVGFS